MGGEIKELDTDLYVFKAHEGSERKLVARGGGWPSWADDSTVYFHRKAEDGWWSIFRITFSESQEGPVETERITPPGVHAFTPAASRAGKWIAVATRRPDFSEYRYIEIFVLSSRSFVKLKEPILPDAHHAFPSVSPDGKWVVFRSGRSGHKNLYIMDAIHGEEEGSLRRLTEGAWTVTMASWAHDGEWIAFSSDRHNPGGGSFALYFIHPNGTGPHRVLNSSTGGRVNHPFFSPDSVFTTDYAGVSAEPVSVPRQFQPYGEIFLAKIDGSELKRLTHNCYEDGTPSWGAEFSDPKDSDGERSKCGFADCTFLGPPNGENLKATTCV